MQRRACGSNEPAHSAWIWWVWWVWSRCDQTFGGFGRAATKRASRRKTPPMANESAIAGFAGGHERMHPPSRKKLSGRHATKNWFNRLSPDARNWSGQISGIPSLLVSD